MTKHVVIANNKPSTEQTPGKYLTNEFKKGLVTNEFQAEYKNLRDILKRFSQGQNIILSDVNLTIHPMFYHEKDPWKKLDHVTINFVSSDIFAIDVDDVNFETDPVRVFESQNGKSAGMYYTFSHGKKDKGNRYRLVYQLDEKVTNINELKSIIEIVQEDLIEQGVPGIDKVAKNPVAPVRGGILGYKIHPNPTRLNTQKLLLRVRERVNKREQDLEERRKQAEDMVLPPFDILREAAEKIGYLPSGAGVTEEWLRLIYGLRYATDIGQITDDEGFELFDIISGGEQDRDYWDKMNADGRATIGSFIDYAKKKGYVFKHNYSNEETIKPTYKHEVIKISDYINKDDAKRLIDRNERLLVDSPTGSGKTTAFLNAMKDLTRNDVSKSNIYILSVPTIALVDQQAKRHNLLAVKSGDRYMFKPEGTLQEYIKAGNRVIVSTYDMTSRVIKFLREQYNHFRYSIVVDEIHKFIKDYDYRYLAIKSLEKVSKEFEVVSYIGLSGTPEEVYKNEFDKVIEFRKENYATPAEKFQVYTYKDRKNEIPYLIQVIHTLVRAVDRKLLVFIESKKAIKQIEKVLRKKGIKVVSLTADSKDKKMYKQLIENETVPEDISIILTTTVISDGVNILNDHPNWTTITAASSSSNLFNISTIRQMSNRLRNPYHSHAIFMQEPKHEKEKAMKPFNLEGAFAYRLKSSEDLVNELQEFITEHPGSFLEGVIEKERGVFLKKDKELLIDHTHVRHQTIKERESYYRYYRKAFINAISNSLGVPLSLELNLNEAITNGDLKHGFLDTKEEAQKAAEDIRQDEEDKKNNISKLFTFDVYVAYGTNDADVIGEFEKQVLPRHSRCVKGLCNIFDYHICKEAVLKVNRDADTHKLRNDIRYMMDYCYEAVYGLKTKTWKILSDLLKINEFIPNADYDEELERIAKKRRASVKEVRKVENMVEVVRKRTGKTRMKKIEGKTFGSLETEHEIDVRDIVRAMERMTEFEVLRGKQKARMKEVIERVKEEQSRREIEQMGWTN